MKRKKRKARNRLGYTRQGSRRDACRASGKRKWTRKARQRKKVERKRRANWQRTGSVRKAEALVDTWKPERRRKALASCTRTQRRARKSRYGGRKGARVKRRVRTQATRVHGVRRGRRRRGHQGWNPSVRANLETRVDVRRWRAARAPTRGRARRRVKHDAVEVRDAAGQPRVHGARSGRQRKPGRGLRIRPTAWARRAHTQEAARVAGAKWVPPYREVDRRTGTRVLVKTPRSGEIYVPSGRKVAVRGVER